MSSNNNKDMQHEALDRIHVVQTLLSSILYDGMYKHSGLCSEATHHLSKVLDNLAAAYNAQSDAVFEEEDK